MGATPEHGGAKGMTQQPVIFTGGSLRFVNLGFVDQIWHEMPAGEVLSGLGQGTLMPPKPTQPIPAQPQTKTVEGLHVALGAMTLRKCLDQPLTQNLAAKRELAIPWKWFSHIPDLRDETRADDRLIQMAEVTRIPTLTAAEIMAVSSVVNRRMVGADDVKQDFLTWGSDRFQELLIDAKDSDVSAVIQDTWGDLVPLLAALELESEGELVATVNDTLTTLRATVIFARKNTMDVIPYTKESWQQMLKGRAQNRLT